MRVERNISLQKCITIIMSSVISVRVPRELKDKMKEIKVNWSEEIRKFIEQTIDKYEAKKQFRKLRKF